MKPTNILRTVVRYLILTEAKTQSKRLRAFTNKITREVMSLYKSGFASSAIQVSEDDLVHDSTFENAEMYEINAGRFPLSFDPSTLDQDDFEDVSDLDTFVTVLVEINRSGEKFNVSASDKSMTGMSDFGLHIAIETPPNFADKKLGELRREVANSIRHELEHITQGPAVGQYAGSFGRKGDYWQFLGSPNDVDSSYAKYLLQPEEIPAHVKGYAQNVKNIKEMELGFEDLLSNYVEKDLITNIEAKFVKGVWLDWAQKNIHKKGF